MYYNQVLCFITFAVILTGGSGLKCFECVGPTNGGCANANAKDLIKMTCKQHKFMNKPISQYMELENAIDVTPVCAQAEVVVEGEVAIERLCTFVPQGADFCEILKQILQVKECSTCTKDYCNSKVFK